MGICFFFLFLSKGIFLIKQLLEEKKLKFKYKVKDNYKNVNILALRWVYVPLELFLFWLKNFH